MNVYKQREKKCGKLVIRDIFLSARAITSGKNQWMETKLKLDLHIDMPKHVTNIK
jgi:hypothetical protein